MPLHAAVQTRKGADLELRSVLVASDFGPASEKAVHYAAAIARRYRSRFYLIHIVSSFGFTIAGPDALAAAADLARRDARSEEKRFARDGIFRDLAHEFIVREGDIWAELKDAIRKYDIEMLVLGTHSRQGLGKLVLGSVAEHVFRHASCPVLTVGPNSPSHAERVISDPYSPIVFATDFTPESLKALPYAISYANRRKTRLVLLHVISPVPHMESTRWYTPDDLKEMERTAVESARVRLRTLISGTKLLVDPMCVALVGSPVEGIVETVRHLRAMGVVLGLKPHADSISHMPWSTAYEIVCNASAPVLTVRN